LKAKRQKLIEAFGYHHAIVESVYDEERERLEDEIALAALDAYDANVEELDIDGVPKHSELEPDYRLAKGNG
jgi:hypothetical protein